MDDLSRPMLKAALAYAQRGFAVFPCKPRGKAPLVKHGLNAATRDETRIRKWWTRWPDANVGIATGAASRLLVVDIDSLEGAKRLGELAELTQLAQNR
jgi:Bifunctional DNA primase/polymerase, N-terminal